MDLQKPEISSIVTQFFGNVPNVLAAYLFGSTVTGRLTHDSDVDVGLLFDGKVDAFTLMSMKEDLATLLKRDVDLIDLNAAPVVLRMQVLKNGEKILERSSTATSRFFVRTILEYFDLKQVRKPIEMAMASGQLHG